MAFTLKSWNGKKIRLNDRHLHKKQKIKFNSIF